MTNFAHLEGFTVAADGFRFPSSQVASTDANTLDDYEESAFTPLLQFGGGVVGLSASIRAASYTKVGRLVYFKVDIGLGAKGTSTGDATITLPFAAAGDVNAAVTFGHADNMASITGQLMAGISAGASAVSLVQCVSGAMQVLTHANFTNTSRIIISGTYSV